MVLTCSLTGSCYLRWAISLVLVRYCFIASRAEQCDQSSSSLEEAQCSQFHFLLLFLPAIRSHLICGKNFKNNVWMDKEEKEKEDSL